MNRNFVLKLGQNFLRSVFFNEQKTELIRFFLAIEKAVSREFVYEYSNRENVCVFVYCLYLHHLRVQALVPFGVRVQKVGYYQLDLLGMFCEWKQIRLSTKSSAPTKPDTMAIL